MNDVVIPGWAWVIVGGAFLVLMGMVKFLATREIKRTDELHRLVADHVRKEEVVWLQIANIDQNTTDMDERVNHLEDLANGNVAALTTAIGTMTKTLADVLERRVEPRV